MIDLLVPVLGRPRNAQPLVDSIRASTSVEHAVHFICSRGDDAEIAACRKTGANVLVYREPPGPGDFARKINWAFGVTEAEWVFQGADDIRFSPGWDRAALDLAQMRGAQVIGTNDLHNPAVKRRLHSTHTLFSRSYIEQQGGTFDGSGTVFCELYDHQFCDTEFVETARGRGVWAFCRESVVEHLHPHWGLAEMDDTYRKAFSQYGPDRQLYIERYRQIVFNGKEDRMARRRQMRYSRRR